MNTAPAHRNAEVLDILFAIALGEGFISGMHDYKHLLVSGDVFSWGEPGQGFCRIMLCFLIIILSWLHFRGDTMTSSEYPRGEFITDVLVAITYMTLFVFVDTPVTFYAVIAVIWFFYAIARALAGLNRPLYVTIGFVFAALFVLMAWWASVAPGGGVEWARILLVTALVIAYRPIDARLRPWAAAGR